MLTLLLAVLYLTFVSLGLPDSVLGSAWPTMFVELNVPVSYAGIVSAIIAAGTIFSSLMSDRITRRFGSSKTTAFSVLMTAIALLGFSVSTEFWMICLIAIPYGLGAGSVDAALNNYVSLHFESKHMSWLHCMWGLGAAIGPTIMGYVLTSNGTWHNGYFVISIIQVVICVVVFISLPIWKKPMREEKTEQRLEEPLKLREIVSIKGAKAVMITFFCYCALEATTILWASTYLNLNRGIDADTAALWGGLYVLGITIGRAISGFITMRLNDIQTTRLGEGIMALGLVMIFIPVNAITLAGIVVFGLGSAPVYPCIIHSTPERFGKDKSQAIIGVQMASAYTGTCLMPPLFGLIANHISVALFPAYIGVLTIAMIVLFEVLIKKTAK
ncbi:MAG: MFS transporter [Clostridia bacterium]|nr:MFS transporter [Clostridia bacterium]